jgi:hypothetical protein
VAVAAGFLPAQSTQTLDHEQVRVSPCWFSFKVRAWLRGYARRYNDLNLWVTFRNGLVGRLPVIGPIGSDLANLMFDLIEQWTNLGRVINVLLCQYRGHYQPSAGVHCQVQLSLATPRFGAMLFLQPFARTKDLQPGAVDQDVCRPCGQCAPLGNRLQAHGAPTHSAVIGDFQIHAQQCKDRSLEAIRPSV